MIYLIITIVVLATVSIILTKSKEDEKPKATKTYTEEIKPGTKITVTETPKKQDYRYRRKKLITVNERIAYYKIKEVTNELGLTLFTKVRLFDLIEPIPGRDNYKGAMWKIQAKHVDFVICDPLIEPILIIELDDSSHNRKDRQERDAFVDDVLAQCGYRIIHQRNIDTEILKRILERTRQKVN